MKTNKQIRCERFKFYQILGCACFDGGNNLEHLLEIVTLVVIYHGI